MDLCSETGRVPNSCQARDGLKQLLAPCAEAVTGDGINSRSLRPGRDSCCFVMEHPHSLGVSWFISIGHHMDNYTVP